MRLCEQGVLTVSARAFPLADAWLGLACLFALVCLRRGLPAAHFWLVCAGSAGLYLFGMDFLYDVENGIFTSGGSSVESRLTAIEDRLERIERLLRDGSGRDSA